jgi:hypothetical protein
MIEELVIIHSIFRKENSTEFAAKEKLGIQPE